MKVTDSIPRSFGSCVIYRFTCMGCNFVYVGETSRHLFTEVRAHLFTDKKSNISKLSNSSDKCSGAGKGARGRSPPNVERDGPRNSSKFDEKIGRGCVSISDARKS